MNQAKTNNFKCGRVAIVGRPNVGKSTLLNGILGQKISITSRKPQTTRHNILGIYTDTESQMLFIDTPGQHLATPKALNRYMNKAATSTLREVDVIVLVLDRMKLNEEDQLVIERVKQSGIPCVAVINKIDRLPSHNLLFPHVERLLEIIPNVQFLPASALRQDGLDQLKKLITDSLPQAPAVYDEDQVTDRSMRFLVAEIVREKIIRQLGAEVPYSAAVEIERYERSAKITHINALILVEREGQKTILIGDKGSRLKLIGIEARKDIERLCDGKVMLELWVKIRSGWSDDERALQSLGYD